MHLEHASRGRTRPPVSVRAGRKARIRWVGASGLARSPDIRDEFQGAVALEADDREIPPVEGEDRGVHVHGPRVTVVQRRTGCGGMRADSADIGPEATPVRASVSSDRRAQALMRLPPFRALGRVSQRTLDFRIRLMSWTRPWPRQPPVRAAAVPRRTRRRAGPSGREPQSNQLRMPASTRSMVSRQSPPWGDGSNAVRTDEIRCL